MLLKMKNRIFLIAILLLCFTGEIFSQDALSILKKMDQTAMAVKDKSSNIEMTLINLKSDKEKVKKATIIQKGRDRKLFRYTYPKSDEGIATLSLPNGEIYVYLPLFKKPKKITNLADTGLNNSDFSTEDMVEQLYAEDYNAKIIETNNTAFVLDLNSKKGDQEYNHLIVHINKKFYYPEKFEFYDKKDNLEKVSTSYYKKIGGCWVANEVSMENIKKKHKTIIVMTNIKINQGLSDDEFTLEKLSGPVGDEH
jgi:outer membrane lipoprotein-sorting protein